MIATNGQFHTTLSTYSGPLDLLLYLIKENEVEIIDLPIITITEQYLEAVAQVEKFDPNHASEFLILAATLIEIKSKMLLPREEVDLSEIEDPRSDLIEQLLAYQEFKNKARNFHTLFEQRKLRFPRGRSFEAEDSEDSQVDLGDVDSWDLFTLMQKIMSETLKEVPVTIAYEDIPISVHMDQIISDLDSTKSTSFREVVKRFAKDRIHLVGMFVAILELTRRKYIRLEQSKDFSDIHILAIEGKNYENVKFSEDEIIASTEPENVLHEKDEEVIKNELEEGELSEEEESVTFGLDKENEDNHSLEIDGFYKTNYRKDKNEEGEEELPKNVLEEFLPEEESISSGSLDIDKEMLEIIRHKIPVPIFDPQEEDIKFWREKNPDAKAEDFVVDDDKEKSSETVNSTVETEGIIEETVSVPETAAETEVDGEKEV